MEQKYITDKNGNKVLPITHINAVRDSNGNNLSSVFGTFKDIVNTKLSQQDEKLELLNGSEVEVVLDHTSVTNPDPQKIYREQGTTSYIDWMYQNNEWKDIATYTFPGVDDKPTEGSEYLVKSGGVQNELALGNVYDVSAHNNNISFASLGALLSDADLNTLIPTAVRKGGMSIKFIQTTPAKYTVVKTEGATEQPTGTEIQSDPGISSGTYTAGELSAFDALPATLNSSLTYYLAVTETVDEQEVTTCTTWVITYVQSSDNKYVQYRYTSNDAVTNNKFTNVANWKDDTAKCVDYDSTNSGLHSNNVQEAIDTLASTRNLKIIDKNLNENLDFADSNGRVFAKLKSNGHFQTKKFDSETTLIRISSLEEKSSTVEESSKDIEFVDKNYNKAFEVNNGDIVVRNFDSSLLGESGAGRNGCGFITKVNIDDADYCFIPFYGQSFTVANDGEYKLTTEFDENVYMVGDTIRTYNYETEEGSGITDTSPVQIKPLNTNSNEELTAADAASLISKLWKKYAHKSQDFIVATYGKGSSTISMLSDDSGYYTNRFLKGIEKAKNSIEAINKTFSCPCIVFLQGESDTAHGCMDDTDAYKAAFISLKNKMQQDIMNATGQTEKPIVMIYTIGSVRFSNENYGISTAQIELAEENDDVICAGPYYQTPTINHPSPDGRRWLGEMLAKCYYENIMIGIDNFMRVVDVKRGRNSIALKVKNAVLPLVVDTTTVPNRNNLGFRVWAEDIELQIKEIFIKGDTIYLRLNYLVKDLQNLKVAYGDTYGGGNIRDSEKWISYYLYESNKGGIRYTPLWKDGTTMIGHHYITSKWLPIFSFSF